MNEITNLIIDEGKNGQRLMLRELVKKFNSISEDMSDEINLYQRGNMRMGGISGSSKYRIDKNFKTKEFEHLNYRIGGYWRCMVRWQ